MTTEPLVSILIPAFNAQEWIAETIESALGQTWPRKEIIVVDDGSRDATFTIGRQFASKSVQVVTQPNQGAAAARNKAYSMCQGDYIQWLDADDLLAKDKIEKQLAALGGCSNSRTLLSGAWGHFFYRVDRARFCATALWRDLAPVDWLLLQMGQNVFMANSSWLVSRELTEAAGPWNVALSADDDGEYFCRVILASRGTRFVPDAKAYYRRTGNGSLSNVDGCDKRLESQFRSIALHIAYLRALRDDAKTRAACLNYLQPWPFFFLPERPDLVRQMEQMAAELGGCLQAPRLDWKYAWLEQLLGFHAAKRTQFFFPALKSRVVRSWDKAMFRLNLEAMLPA